jgi:hypothetical protein
MPRRHSPTLLEVALIFPVALTHHVIAPLQYLIRLDRLPGKDCEIQHGTAEGHNCSVEKLPIGSVVETRTFNFPIFRTGAGWQAKSQAR